MGKILSAYISPHPPIIVEDIGRGETIKAKNTIVGVEKIGEDIKAKRPSTIILITPHGPLFSDAISISCEEELWGDFANFGYGNLQFHFKNNRPLVDSIRAKGGKRGIAIAPIDSEFAKDYGVSLKIDHGALVPLYFVNKHYEDYKLIHITYGLLSPLELYEFGKVIQESVLESQEDVVLIASGDLSHRLSTDGPYSYVPEGKLFDEKIVKYFEENDLESILSFDLELSERAGECGLRSFMIMAGFLDSYSIDTHIYSYEGPFGVGYMTAKIELLGSNNNTNIFDKVKIKEAKRIEDIRKNEDEYVSLARRSLEHFVRSGNRLEIPQGLDYELLNNRAGVFVTLKKDGKLRGCIGTIEPIQDSIAEEIIENAISAGIRDPRFDSVVEDELEHIIYSVDVLKEPEQISSIDELDVEKYGVIVSKGFRKGLLLPNIEGVNFPEEQVRIALQKAGIGIDENYNMERFEVIRHY